MADKRDILVRLLGEETVSRMAGRAEKGLDKFGDSLDATEKDAKDLDAQIAEVEGSLKTLAVAFARTGDAADRVDLSKAMRRQTGELKKLTRSRSLLPSMAAAGAKAGTEFGVSLGAKIGPLLAKLPLRMGPVGAAIGGVMAVALVPTLGAAIGGAVLGGVGTGGVIGGIVLAARDSRVKAAGAELGATVMGDLEDSATRFVQPTIHGIGIIRNAWTDVAGDVDGIFAATSRFVEPLARGVAGMMREIGPGLRQAAEAAGPVMREIGDGLAGVGRALGDLFSKFADNADAGASSVRFLFMVVEAGIDVTGTLVGVFSDMYRQLLDVADVSSLWMETLYGRLPFIGDQVKENRARVVELKDALKDSGDAGGVAGDKIAGKMRRAGESGGVAGDKIAGGLRKIGEAATTATPPVKTLAEFIDESIGRAHESEDAADRQAEAFQRLGQAAKDGAGKGIDRHTEAGLRNRQALRAAAQAANLNAAQVLKTTGSHELAAAVTEKARKGFLRAAAGMGVEKGEAIALANKLFGLPKEVKTKADFQPDNAGVKAWKRTLSGIPRNIFIRAEFDLINNKEVSMALRLGRLSAGGPVTGPGPKGVDSKPYLLAPGEHVLTAREVDAAGGHAGVERIRAVLRGGGGQVAATGGGGGRPAPSGAATVNSYSINVSVGPTANLGEIGRQVVESIRAYEQRSGRGWRTA